MIAILSSHWKTDVAVYTHMHAEQWFEITNWNTTQTVIFFTYLWPNLA